jgi:hypothetical protein
MFGRRPTKYELHVQIDNRWLMQSVFDDEKTAVTRAKQAVLAKDAQAVKVIEELTGLGGRRKEREVFTQKAPVGASSRNVCLEAEPFSAKLETVEDLYQPVIRRATGQIIKNFLTEVGISPTELYFNGTNLKRFRREERLPSSFYFAFLKYWQNPTEKDTQKMLGTLDQLFNEAMIRARDFEAAKTMVFTSADQAAEALANGASLDDPYGHFSYTCALCGYLGEHRAWPAKMDELFKVAIAAKNDGLWALVDEMSAEILEMSDMIRDVLGDHKSLADALMVLSDLCIGSTFLPGPGSWVNVPWLIKAIRKGYLPRTQAMLVLRLVRAMGGDNPLTKQGARRDGQALGDLRKKLTLPNGDLLGGQHMEAAFERRWDRVRKQILAEG